MHRKIDTHGQNTRKNGNKRSWRGFAPLAGRLMLIGMLLVSAGICDVAARAYDGMIGGEIGLFLRMRGDVESLWAAAAILIGGGLLLDFCERVDR